MTNSEVQPSPKKSRIEYIDLLRGWAVIVMIETHVMNATLSTEASGEKFFQYVKFLNGLVAPSFLFAAGLAYAITTRRKFQDYLSFGPPLFKQIRRLLFVVMIGYVLHLPKFNFDQIIHETTLLSWQTFFQADVLQCIGVSLLIIQGLLLLLKNENRLYQALLVLSLIVVFVTPLVWGIDFRYYLPLAISGYMNGIHFPDFPGFPLFPWAAFLFAGAIFGHFYLKAKEAAATPGSTYDTGKMMKRVLLMVPLLIVFASLIEPLGNALYPFYDYWRFSPSFVLFRLALVMAIAVGLFYYEKWRTVSPKSPVTLIGRESLIVYSVHLLLIYGSFGSFNFQKQVNHSFGFAEASIATGVLLLLMYFLALVWDKLRRDEPIWKRRIELAIAAILVGVFFFGPGE